MTLPVLVGKSAGDDLVAMARDWDADLVVVDANLGGALAAAETLTQPSAVVLHSMYKTFVDTWFADIWPFVGPGVNETRAAYHLADAVGWPSVFAGHQRLLSVVPAAFDAPVALVPASMCHFGFLTPRRAASARASRSATISTGISIHFLFSAALVTYLPEAHRRFGIARVLLKKCGKGFGHDTVNHWFHFSVT